MIKMSFECNDF